MASDYAKNYFALGNAITGFAVVQTITFIVAFGTSTEFAGNVSKAPGWSWVIAGAAIAAVLYTVAVIACGFVEVRLLPSTERDLIRLIGWTIAARTFAIVAISSFGLLILWQISQLDLIEGLKCRLH